MSVSLRRSFRRATTALACAGLVAASALPAAAQTLTPIKVSYQIAYWALPIYIATEKGWWAEAGLKPE